MELAGEVYAALKRYFSVLKHTGYKKYCDVYRLLALVSIEEMLYGPMAGFVTEKDYQDISKALNCLQGSCMIPFPDYLKGMDGIVERLPDEFRVTEETALRLAENFNLRTMS